MENNPLISIVTVNYNSTDITCELLKSINNLAYNNIEVIIVDNDSAEDPSPELHTVNPVAKIILNDRNSGYAGGNNVGIKAAKGEYIFTVNNDTTLTPNIMDGLLEVFQTYPDAGVACPKVHYYDSPDTIEFAGYKKVNEYNGRNSMIGCGEKDNGQYDHVSITHYAHGAAMMIPAKVIAEVGLMPEIYFLYYEEFDWCEQIKRKGYKIYYQYKSLIYHKESMAVGKKSILKTFYLNRNRILFMRRNVKGFPLFIFSLYFLFITLPVNSFIYLLKKETGHLKAFWKGFLWNLTNRNLKNIL